jgi:hypothetical protein
VSVATPVHIRAANAEAWGTSRNLSRGGMFVECEGDVGADELGLEFRLPGSADPLCPTARVIWRRPQAGAPTGLGVRFLELDARRRATSTSTSAVGAPGCARLPSARRRARCAGIAGQAPRALFVRGFGALKSPRSARLATYPSSGRECDRPHDQQDATVLADDVSHVKICRSAPTS